MNPLPGLQQPTKRPYSLVQGHLAPSVVRSDGGRKAAAEAACGRSDSLPDLGPGICCIVRRAPPTPFRNSSNRGWGSAMLADGLRFFPLENTGLNLFELGCRYGCRYSPGLLPPCGGLPACAARSGLLIPAVPPERSSAVAITASDPLTVPDSLSPPS